jgi:hypothetical protein
MLIAEKGYTWEEVKKLDENDEMTYVNIGEWFDVKTLDVQHFLMGFDCQLPEKLNDDDKAGNEAALFVGLEMI